MFRLGLYQSSKNSWTYNLTDHLQYPNYDDVIYYNDKFYVVDYYTGLATINYDSTDPARLDTVVERKPPLDDMFSLYIVSTTNGDLLLIQRILDQISSDDTETRTMNFEIYKLNYPEEGENDEQQRKAHWVEIDSIGTDALFLGDNHSMSISTLDFPACKPNCIYYTDHFHKLFFRYHKPCDMGIFELEKRSSSQHYVADHEELLMPHGPPPVWILPTLQGDH